MANREIKILAIDDNQDNLLILKALVKESFPEAMILTALNGKKGLELAADEDPDMILLDIVMPGMDGFDVCRRLKADTKLQDIPVIFVTAIKGDKESRIHALEAGAEAFLAKPIDESELTAQIRAMVKIRTAHIEKRSEKERLAALLEEQTRELKEKHTAALTLLEDLKREYEARKRSEMALQESEARYERAVSGANDGIWEWTPATGEIFLSARLKKLLGHEDHELPNLQASFFGRIHPDEIQLILKAFRAHFENHKPVEIELRLRCKNGEYRWFLARGQAMRDEHSQPRRMAGSITDITARKRNEETLRSSEERHRAILHTAMDGFWLADMEGCLLEVNAAYCHMSGYSAQELLAMKITDLEAQEAATDITAHIHKTMSQGGDRFESWHRRKDGSLFNVEISVQYQPIDGGRLVAFLRDITAYRRTEENYRTLFCEMLDGFALHEIICDEQGKPSDYRFLAVNPAFERLTGLKGEELIGRTVLEALPETEQKWIETYGKVAITGEPVFIENFHAGLNKHFAVKAFRAAPGQFVCIFEDTTESKQAEHALRKSNDKFLTLVENIPGHIAYVNATTLQYEFVNAAFEKSFGIPQEKIIGRHLKEIIGESNYNFALKYLDEVRSGKSISYENAFNLVSGERWIQVNYAPVLDASGNVGSIVVLSYDITERKKAEEEKTKLEAQLQQAQKMESVGRLAGGVAHDFNNILTAIIGYGNLINMKLTATDPMRHYVDQIIASSNRAADLTRGLLAFSRKNIINLIPVDVNKIVKGMQQILERVIGEHIEFGVKTADQDLMVMCDKSQIEQVLMNLATNARDAITKGGTLSISTEACEIDERFIHIHQSGSVGRYAVISVTDNGTGMDKATKEHIFEPFFTTKEVGKGTGLGLAMAYGTIKQHNGFIHVDTESGMGTTFKIYLPLTTANLLQIEEKTTTDMSLGTETLLLVEDDEAVRTVTRNMMEGFGYNVIEAIDGHHAVVVFQQNKDRVHLVVSDMIMPKLSGKEVHSELKKIKPDIKILYISGYTFDILEQQEVDSSKINFISKPFAPHALSRKLREALDGH